MSEEDYSKPFSHPRWNQPIKGIVVGYEPSTPEEREKNKKEFEEILRSEGILKDGDILEDVDVSKFK